MIQKLRVRFTSAKSIPLTVCAAEAAGFGGWRMNCAPITRRTAAVKAQCQNRITPSGCRNQIGGGRWKNDLSCCRAGFDNTSHQPFAVRKPAGDCP